MSATPPNVIEAIRQEEYTGENRCLPCTVANVIIALALSVVVALAGSRMGTAAMAGVGGVFFLLSLTTIYLRGYLVPGTPELTQQYFPAWLLRAFEKEPGDSAGEDDGRSAVEEFLIEADAVTESWLSGELERTDSFRSTWEERIRELREGDRAEAAFASTIGADPEALRWEEFGSRIVALRDNREVDSWPSRGAFVADIAAVGLLGTRHEDWSRLGDESKDAVLARLRELRDRCPACDGPLVTETEETVASCCRSAEIHEVYCDDCGARIYEAEQ